MKKYSRKESMQFLDISYLRERQLQYDLIKELEGTLDHYIESRYVDPYEYLKSRLKTISKTIPTEIKIPNSVQNIKGYAFYHCAGLTRMEIPNNVKTIGKYAFSYCKNLKEIIIDNTAEFVFMNWDMNWNANCNANITYLR